MLAKHEQLCGSSELQYTEYLVVLNPQIYAGRLRSGLQDMETQDSGSSTAGGGRSFIK